MCPFLFKFTVSTQSTKTGTQEGSSFESASSIYSLARVDAICEDTPGAEEILPLPPILQQPVSKHSPSHSDSSTSSTGSYCTSDLLKVKKSLPTCIGKPMPASKHKSESVSDDDKSEKRYSSSGYYESPHDEGNKIYAKKKSYF